MCMPYALFSSYDYVGYSQCAEASPASCGTLASSLTKVPRPPRSLVAQALFGAFCHLSWRLVDAAGKATEAARPVLLVAVVEAVALVERGRSSSSHARRCRGQFGPRHHHRCGEVLGLHLCGDCRPLLLKKAQMSGLPEPVRRSLQLLDLLAEATKVR